MDAKNTNFTDVEIICRDCGTQFTVKAAGQAEYKKRNMCLPARCPDCRKLYRKAADGEVRKYIVICASCGKETTVPFEPTLLRPIYCLDCIPTKGAKR